MNQRKVSDKPRAGRMPVAQDQKRQVMHDRRTKRRRDRGQAKRAAIREDQR